MIFDVFGTLFIFRVFLHFFFLQNRKKGNNFEKQRKRNDKRKSAYYVKCNSFILIKSTKTKGQRTDYFFFRLIYHWCFVIQTLHVNIFNQLLYLSFSVFQTIIWDWVTWVEAVGTASRATTSCSTTTFAGPYNI